MRIVLGNQVINPPVLLAPLAGITDVPFRNLVQSFGAGLVVSEMVASHEMVQKKPGVRERAELGFGIASTSVQIAGREAYWMAEAARMIESNGAKIIDINMGCPAKKVTSGQSGSALMRTPDFALELVEAVVKATSLDVTLKMRLGWDDNSLNAPYIAARAEAAGIKMITVHGRTRCQFYNGAANWAAISQVKAAVSIPVIANGDIVDVASARLALEQSGADGIMEAVGHRALLGAWLKYLLSFTAPLNRESHAVTHWVNSSLAIIKLYWIFMVRFWVSKTRANISVGTWMDCRLPRSCGNLYSDLLIYQKFIS